MVDNTAEVFCNRCKGKTTHAIIRDHRENWTDKETGSFWWYDVADRGMCRLP